MAMTDAIPDPSTASIILDTDYSGLERATIWRYLGGATKPQKVRGYILKETGQEVPPFRDYEMPMGVQVGYASLNWPTAGPEPAPPVQPDIYATLNVTDTTGWLKFPARPELNFPLACITTLPERKFEGNSETYRIIGRSRPIAIHDVMTWWEGSIEWVCPSKRDHDTQVAVISEGTICMIQTMPAYGGINEFIVVSNLSTAHVGPARADFPQRLMTLEFTTIDAPVGTYNVTVTYTYDQMKADWPTYNDVKAHYANYYRLYLNDRS